jgi:hypothetical protein
MRMPYSDLRVLTEPEKGTLMGRTQFSSSSSSEKRVFLGHPESPKVVCQLYIDVSDEVVERWGESSQEVMPTTRGRWDFLGMIRFLRIGRSRILKWQGPLVAVQKWQKKCL